MLLITALCMVLPRDLLRQLLLQQALSPSRLLSLSPARFPLHIERFGNCDIDVNDYTTKVEILKVFDTHGILYRVDKAPAGDSLLELKDKLLAWLTANAVEKEIKYNLTYLAEICSEHGHRFLLTPPYHPGDLNISKINYSRS